MIRAAPTPFRPCFVTITNQVDAVITAVCVKWMLANRLATGATSPKSRCPCGERIEFHLEEAGDESGLHGEWAYFDGELKSGREYLIVLSGPATCPSFDVKLC